MEGSGCDLRRVVIAGPTFFLSAAEHSGDALGAAVIPELLRRFPEATFVGVGGPRMAAAGCRLIASPVGRSAMLLGALGQAKYWWGVMGQIKKELASVRPSVVIPIDSSAVNLKVAETAKRQGIPVCYYVAPQLWASRPWRIAKVRRWVDTLCCILPFEEEYFRKQGVKAVYVGHPMFDTPAESAETDPGRVVPALAGMDDEARVGLPAGAKAYPHFVTGGSPVPRVAIFPGSRKGEIKANLPPMLEIVGEIKGRFGKVHFVIVAPSEERAWQVRHHLRQFNIPIDIRVGVADAVIRWADVVLTKSGTATLQIARHHKPMVVMYAVSRLVWNLAGRFLVNTKYIALVNILANRELVPEFVPFYGSPLPVAREMIELLNRPELRATMARELEELTQPLLPPGEGRLAAMRVADEVCKLMKPAVNTEAK